MAITIEHQCQCIKNEMKSVLITQNNQHSTKPLGIHKKHLHIKQYPQYGIFKVQHTDNQAHGSRSVDHHFTQIIDFSEIEFLVSAHLCPGLA